MTCAPKGLPEFQVLEEAMLELALSLCHAENLGVPADLTRDAQVQWNRLLRASLALKRQQGEPSAKFEELHDMGNSVMNLAWYVRQLSTIDTSGEHGEHVQRVWDTILNCSSIIRRVLLTCNPKGAVCGRFLAR